MVWKILRNQAGFEWLRKMTGIDPTGFAYATYLADAEMRQVELYIKDEDGCLPLVFDLPVSKVY